MGLKDAIISWIFKNARIPKAVLVGAIDKVDADQDGYIDLAEFVQGLREIWDYVKRK